MKSSLPDRVLNAARNLKTDAVTAEVVGAFEDAGVPVMLLKGPSFARWLYDGAGERPYSDTDIMVPSESIDVAESILAALGFEHEPLDDLTGDKPWHAHAWLRAYDGANVDLHRTLVGIGVTDEETWEVLAAQVQELLVGGRQVPSLSIAARAFHVALHAAQDGLLLVQARGDLERALARVDLQVWREAAALATQLGALEAFGAGLRLDPKGSEIATQLGLPDARSIDVLMRADKLPEAAIGLWWLQSQPGARAKISFLWHKVFPPLEFLKAWAPWASRGPIGVPIAYAWRVVWLMSKAPAAITAYLRARARSRR